MSVLRSSWYGSTPHIFFSDIRIEDCQLEKSCRKADNVHRFSCAVIAHVLVDQPLT